MILLNLLPHREAARKQLRNNFYASLALAVFAGMAVAFIGHLILQSFLTDQLNRNEFLKSEIAKLDIQIKEVASLEEEINGLQARKKAVEDLQAGRNQSAHLVNEFARLLPEGMYLTGIKQDGQKVSILGVAQSNQRISEFLKNLATNSEWVENPELVEIVASTTTVAQKDLRPTATFNIAVREKVKATTVVKPVGAVEPASGPKL
jgi:type IV pilus assembly protein PilN